MRTLTIKTIFVCSIFPFIFFYSLHAYQNGSSNETKYEIKEIEFRGNSSFKEDILLEVIISRESPNWFSKFVYNVLGENFGSKPEFYNSEIVEQDRDRLHIFYNDNGFLDATVNLSCIFDSIKSNVKLTFDIYEGRRSFIDSISYVGLENLPDELIAEILKEQKIKVGQPYIKNQILSEINRVLDFLANNGYPLAQYDQTKSFAKRFLSTNNLKIELFFNAGRRYKFGETSIKVEPKREDITSEIVLRHLDFKEGEIYSREKKISSERNINRLGLFESARVENLIASDSSLSDFIPIEIFLRPKYRNEIFPEFIVSDESNTFNLGIGIGYTNRNFFGDARLFNIRLRFRSQDIQRWNFRDAFKGELLRDPTIIGAAELQLQIVQPYLFSRSMSGSLTSTLIAEKQSQLILSILRNKIGVSNQFATYTYGLFEWTLERSSPKIIQESARPEILLHNLRQEDRPQFNSIITMTLQRDKTNDIFSPTAGFFHSITVEESGILPKLFPGIRTGLPFTQYYKVALTGRWYKDLSRTKYNIFALKLKAGYQDKYGESKYSNVSIPLTRRFFGGGSGSVRGWKARDLGAMLPLLREFGGNFMLESSTEMRVHYFRGYGKLGFIKLENLWGVYFLDFGNVWSSLSSFRPKDIAVAAGIGLRYETFFGPFRVDYGFRIYDPTQTVEKHTIFQKRFFSETLGDAVFHFGIGHAF